MPATAARKSPFRKRPAPSIGAKDAPRITSRTEKAEASRAAIIAAARIRFDTQSYNVVSLRAVARDVGLTTGAIFSHFTGKADLYAAVFGHPPITPEQGRDLKSQVEQLQAQCAEHQTATGAA